MRVWIAACLVGLAGCASVPEGTPFERGSSRADGIVAMATTVTPYQPVQPDWATADETAARRCRAWGHEDQRLAGWRDACRVWDRWGRCTESRTTRYYDCEG